MDAPILRRLHPQQPPPCLPMRRRRRVRVGVAVLLLCAAGFAMAQSQRFDVHASVQTKLSVPSGGGFELRAKLTPATRALQGGGYSVDAIAAPAATCSGGDTIFKNGFEVVAAGA